MERVTRTLFYTGMIIIMGSIWGIIEIFDYYRTHDHFVTPKEAFVIGPNQYFPKLYVIPIALIVIVLIAFIAAGFIKATRMQVLIIILVVLLGNTVYQYYGEYEKKISSYEDTISTLRKEVNKYREELRTANDELLETKNDYNELSKDFDLIYDQYKELEQELGKIHIPDNYYFNNTGDGNYSQLVKYLNDFDMPVEYALNVFDCSEQAAFMERQLENAGFSTYIAVGPAPTNPSVGHAWVIVITSDNYKVAIEPTEILGGMDGATQRMFSSIFNRGNGIVSYEQNSGYYEGYNSLYSDIYEAESFMKIEEFDWWLGMWGLVN